MTATFPSDLPDEFPPTEEEEPAWSGSFHRQLVRDGHEAEWPEDTPPMEHQTNPRAPTEDA